MVSIMAAICPGIKDEETDRIVNMDYEVRFDNDNRFIVFDLGL